MVGRRVGTGNLVAAAVAIALLVAGSECARHAAIAHAPGGSDGDSSGLASGVSSPPQELEAQDLQRVLNTVAVMSGSSSRNDDVGIEALELLLAVASNPAAQTAHLEEAVALWGAFAHRPKTRLPPSSSAAAWRAMVAFAESRAATPEILKRIQLQAGRLICEECQTVWRRALDVFEAVVRFGRVWG